MKNYIKNLRSIDTAALASQCLTLLRQNNKLWINAHNELHRRGKISLWYKIYDLSKKPTK